MALPRRPLPTPPVVGQDRYNVYGIQSGPVGLANSYLYSSFISPFPNPPLPREVPLDEGERPSALRGGTLLHKGFYDLLALIPSTPSPSRFLWRTPNEDLVAGARYEDIPPSPSRAIQSAQSTQGPAFIASTSPGRNLKSRRISKDMVSKPTGFV